MALTERLTLEAVVVVLGAALTVAMVVLA